MRHVYSRAVVQADPIALSQAALTAAVNLTVGLTRSIIWQVMCCFALVRQRRGTHHDD